LAYYNLAMMHTIGAGVMRSCNSATEVNKPYSINKLEDTTKSSKILFIYVYILNLELKKMITR